MEKKAVQVLNGGMIQDTSISKRNNEFAYENVNIRITSTESGDLLSVTNERGHAPCININTNTQSTTNMQYLGHAVVENSIVIFGKDSSYDLIKKYTFDKDGNYTENVLYRGHLNFSAPIETLVSIETEDCKKIYWVDGVNITRVINIENTEVSNNDTQFDFLPTTDLNIQSVIDKTYDGSNLLPAGTYQYFLTFYNIRGAETGIVWASEILFATFEDRAGKPGEATPTKFTLKFSNLDNKFNRARLYCYSMSSENTSAHAYIVNDVEINNGTCIFVDNNTNIIDIDPYELLYLGGQDFIASTLTQKNGKLFLGNIKYNEAEDSDVLQSIANQMIENGNELKDEYITFSRIENVQEDGVNGYNYKINLDKSSTTRGLVRGNRYRFGIQFIKDNTSVSRVYWIGDKIVVPIGKAGIYNASLSLPSSSFSTLMSKGYNHYRVLYVKPSESDRVVKSQGIINPTVFNLFNRYYNTVYSQASWVTRPINGNLEFNHLKPIGPADSDRGEIQGMDYGNDIPSVSRSDIQTDSDVNTNIQWYVLVSIYFKNRKTGALVSNRKRDFFFIVRICAKYPNTQNKYDMHIWTAVDYDYTINLTDQKWEYYCNPNHMLSKWSDFIREQFDKFGINDDVLSIEDIATAMSGTAISTAASPNNSGHGKTMYTLTNGNNGLEFVLDDYNYNYTEGISIGEVNKDSVFDSTINNLKGNFFVDESIVTYHTPDLSYSVSDENVTVVGAAPVNSVQSSFDIEVSDIYNSEGGKNSLIVQNKAVGNGALWIDSEYEGTDEDDNDELYDDQTVSYYIYLWHNSKNILGKKTKEKKYSVINNKIFAYRTFCDDTVWLNNKLPLYPESIVINRNTAECLNIENQSSMFLRDVDVVVMPSKTDENSLCNYNIYDAKIGSYRQSGITDNSILSMKYKTSDSAVLVLSSPLPRIGKVRENEVTDEIYRKERIIKNGTVFYLRGVNNTEPIIDSVVEVDFDTFERYRSIDVTPVYISQSSTDNTPILYEVDLGAMCIQNGDAEYESGKYKLRFSLESDIPTYIKKGVIIIDVSRQVSPFEFTYKLERDFEINDAFTSVISPYYGEYTHPNMPVANPDFNVYKDKPYMLIAEMTKDVDSSTIYGGYNESALSLNTFTSISSITSINDSCTTNDGDGYYQRYDCLMSYPYSNEDMNQVMDICSVMLVTYTNLDARYDTKRYVSDLLTIDWNNFAPVNTAYNSSGLLTGSTLDSRFNNGNYRSTIAHSLIKSNNDMVDKWTNITLAATLELNSHYGPVNALGSINNNIFAFQDTAITQILYDERTQLSTNIGTPIEIANSTTVASQVLSDRYGCMHKRSIVSAKTGLYFYDYVNGIIASIGEGLVPISTQKGFDKWIRENENYRGYYDSRRGDIYFVTEGTVNTLCYSEYLNQFTSFYTYGNVDIMENIYDEWISLKDMKFWKGFKGNYSTAFGNTVDSYMRYKIVPDPYGDKIFTNLDYRCDFFRKNNGEYTDYIEDKTFDTLEVSNEYQRAVVSPRPNFRGMWTGVGKKFRMWKMDIPRDQSGNGRRNFDRIRNPWMDLKLSVKGVDNKMEFHNLNVIYYE